MKNIVKDLEKLAEKHGAEELEAAVNDIYCNSQVSTMGDPPVTCQVGKVWNEILKKCVDDLG